MRIDRDMKPAEDRSQDLDRKMGTNWPKLGNGEVHIWHVNLDLLAPGPSFLLLSSEERARVERFHFKRDGIRFGVCRSTLRRILGSYLAGAPESLEFVFSAHGKPALKESAVPLEFNVSHSREIALIALTKGKPVGVDVEAIRYDFSVVDVAVDVFSARELPRFCSLPSDTQRLTFFETWAAKEAYLKALGTGFSLSPTRIDVADLPVKPVKTIDGFVAAVATAVPLSFAVRQFDFSGTFASA
jgi:4'-phosphopantetheinyl transferase